MPVETRLTSTRLRERRETVIAALQDHFAHDDIDMDEFERRVTAAHTGATLEDIESLLADLPALAGGATEAPGVRTALARAADVRPAQTIRGLMSSTTRSGPWTVPRRLEVKATMSSTVLDFRDARFPVGPVDLEIRALMSSVEIIVPPGLSVETQGSTVMGVFDDVQRAPAQPDPEAPLLRIHGRAVMAAVEVKMRIPGESERQQVRREKLEARRDAQVAPRALPPPRRQ